MSPRIPAYLSGSGEIWRVDPRAANLAWFAQARFGLFLHYGLYSMLGRGEWAMFHERIPVTEYERLADSFSPVAFDADAITDLACEAGMTYVNFTACHHEGFCLWDSETEHFNSMRLCGRDLVRELAEQCQRKGLGFFVYFTHVINWRHPWALLPDRMTMARPAYHDGHPRYLARSDAESHRFWAWSHGCLAELACLEAPVAGTWLDLIKGYYLAPDLVPIAETYALLRRLRPEALIAFKQGATGDEDFAAPEFHFSSQGEALRQEGFPDAAARADLAWAANRSKHNEICMTLQRGGWGWIKGASYRNPEEIWRALGYAHANRCNLLANIGPRPDGSIPAEAAALLRCIGRRLRTEGWPIAGAAGSADAGAGAA